MTIKLQRQRLWVVYMPNMMAGAVAGLLPVAILATIASGAWPFIAVAAFFLVFGTQVVSLAHSGDVMVVTKGSALIPFRWTIRIESSRFGFRPCADDELGDLPSRIQILGGEDDPDRGASHNFECDDPPDLVIWLDARLPVGRGDRRDRVAQLEEREARDRLRTREWIERRHEPELPSATIIRRKQ